MNTEIDYFCGKCGRRVYCSPPISKPLHDCNPKELGKKHYDYCNDCRGLIPEHGKHCSKLGSEMKPVYLYGFKCDKCGGGKMLPIDGGYLACVNCYQINEPSHGPCVDPSLIACQIHNCGPAKCLCPVTVEQTTDEIIKNLKMSMRHIITSMETLGKRIDYEIGNAIRRALNE